MKLLKFLLFGTISLILFSTNKASTKQNQFQVTSITQNKAKDFEISKSLLQDKDQFGKFYSERFYCDWSDLKSSSRRGTIFDFTFSNDCKKAMTVLNQQKGQFKIFCDDDEKQYNTSGKMIVNLTFKSNCHKVINQFINGQSWDDGLFCYDGKLYHAFDGFRKDFTFDSSCKRRLAQMRSHQ